MTCPACGQPLTIGDYPFCPHGRGHNAIETDERWIGGRVFENLGHEPVTLYSRSELKREMQARGLESFVRHAPAKGSDKSPHTTRWVAMDAYTLDAAKALLERQGGVPDHAETEDDRYRRVTGHAPLTAADVKAALES